MKDKKIKLDRKFQITLDEDAFNLIMLKLLKDETTKNIATLLYLHAKEVN